MPSLGVNRCRVGNSDPAEEKEGAPARSGSPSSCVAKVIVTLQSALAIQEKQSPPPATRGQLWSGQGVKTEMRIPVSEDSL